MVISELMNSDIMHFSTDKTYIDELCLIMQRTASFSVASGSGSGSLSMQSASSSGSFCSVADDASAAAMHRHLLFHVQLIKVLVSCTMGKNTFTEIKCHTVLSLEDIDKVVTSRACLVDVKRTYISFLYQCHIDTENETKEIFTQPHIWSIFDTFVRDLELVAVSRAAASSRTQVTQQQQQQAGFTGDPALESYVTQCVVEVITGFFSHSQFTQIPSPQSRAGVYKSLYVQLTKLYHCRWLTDARSASVLVALNAMQEKATFMGIADGMPAVHSLAARLELAIDDADDADSAAATAPTPPPLPTRHYSLTVEAMSGGGASSLVDNASYQLSKARLNKSISIDVRNETRIVNEAFQVRLLFLLVFVLNT